jgi:hypothetical protein
MKLKAQEFINHIEKVNLGGLINEVVLDGDLQFAATDETQSVISICVTPFSPNKFGKLGIFNLDLFMKAIQYSAENVFSSNEEMAVEVVDNRLVFKKGKNSFKFLLSNPDTISSTISNAKEVMEQLRAKEGVSISLKPEQQVKCLRAIQLITPELCTFEVKDGAVSFIVGKDTDHNAVVHLGDTTFKKDFKTLVKPEFLINVLQTIDGKEVSFELREDYPVIFDLKDYILSITPAVKV